MKSVSAFWQTACHNVSDINDRQEGTIMLIGYARTSTLEQIAGLEAQRDSLRAIGCEKVWEERTSSVGVRESLRGAMDYAREGDVLVVTKLDRLARSVRHLGEIVEELEAKKVGLRILDLGLDTNTATSPQSAAGWM